VDGRIKVMLPLATPGHMKAYRGNSVRLHWYLTTKLDGGEQSTSHSCRLPLGEITPLHADWVAEWSSKLDWTFEEEKNLFFLSGTDRPIDQPVTELLYWLRCRYCIRFENNILN
jgi:hypothetical protein